MITYEKINSEYSNIFYNGLKVGRVEVYKYSKKYIVEIDYSRYNVDFKHRQRIPFLINSCIKSRELVKDYLERHRASQIEFINKCKVKRNKTIIS
jgi:hypothetical protein